MISSIADNRVDLLIKFGIRIKEKYEISCVGVYIQCQMPKRVDCGVGVEIN